MPPTTATLSSKQVNFNKIKVIVFGFMFVLKNFVVCFFCWYFSKSNIGLYTGISIRVSPWPLWDKNDGMPIN